MPRGRRCRKQGKKCCEQKRIGKRRRTAVDQRRAPPRDRPEVITAQGPSKPGATGRGGDGRGPKRPTTCQKKWEREAKWGGERGAENQSEQGPMARAPSNCGKRLPSPMGSRRHRQRAKPMPPHPKAVPDIGGQGARPRATKPAPEGNSPANQPKQHERRNEQRNQAAVHSS